MTVAVPSSPSSLPLGAELDPLLGREFESPWRDTTRRFFRNKLAVAGLVFLVIVTFGAVFAPLLSRWDPKVSDFRGILDPKTGVQDYGPSSRHWLGTDRIGRDIFSRLLFGARVSLAVGWSVALVSTVMAIVIGGLAGWYLKAGGVIMRLADMISALPYIVFVVFMTERLGRTMLAVILALLAYGWTSGARLFRAGVLQAKGQDYVEAARATGCSSLRVLFRHILPNAIQPMIVGISFSIGGLILTESVFGFLGLGIVDRPAWGQMVAEGREEIFENGHMFLFPAMALVFTVLAFAFIGEGLRDALDPKLRGIR